jgi:hypothetical protein
MPFPDLDQESRSGILVYLIRGSLVKTNVQNNIKEEEEEKTLKKRIGKR